MDTDAERQKLENEKAFVLSWLEHPVSQEIARDNAEHQDALIDLICNREPDSIGSFFAHFIAIGELRGLRRAKGEIQSSIQTIEQQLKELTNAESSHT